MRDRPDSNAPCGSGPIVLQKPHLKTSRRCRVGGRVLREGCGNPIVPHADACPCTHTDLSTKHKIGRNFHAPPGTLSARACMRILVLSHVSCALVDTVSCPHAPPLTFWQHLFLMVYSVSP